MKAFPELTAALREMLDRMDVSLRAGGYEGPPVIMYLAGRLAHGIHGKGDGRWEEKENDYENEERSRAEEWPTEYTDDTEKPWRRAILSRWRTKNENDFFWGGRAAGAEMAGREPLSRGAGDGGK